MNRLFETVKKSSEVLQTAAAEKITEALCKMADLCEERSDELLAANAKDLSNMDTNSPMYDRLKLTPARISGIAAQIRAVAAQPSPVGEVLSHEVRPNGLDVSRVRVPFGVIGIIYEARPNVTFDVSAICLKSANACLLKGSHNAHHSNTAIVRLIHEALENSGLPAGAVSLLPPTREATEEMLKAEEFVDLIIPRGGRRLIDFVRENATVSVIETGAGTCHVFFDRQGDLKKGADIVNNAKTRRVSVCNALDCLIISAERLTDLPALCEKLVESEVRLYADAPSYTALNGQYPSELLHRASPTDYGKEFLDYAMAIKTVDDVRGAIEHIRKYGSRHSEAIVTEDESTANLFLSAVDAACVYLNAPTSFSDGEELGLGAEIGISTQKLHARGPMGVRELTTYKWIVRGSGQIRP